MRAALALLLAGLLTPVGAGAGTAEDLEAARTLFERNLEAIRQHDRAAYLDCYLDSESLARTGPAGLQLGFDELAEGTGSGWPDAFDGRDLRLVPVGDGLVYGTYRYRVRFGTDEQIGLSERFFVRTPAGWKIAVTTAFDAPSGTPPPPLALVGGTLIDGSGGPPVADATVIVRGGRIDCAGPASRCPVPEGVERVELPGRWITPGLVDTHVHLSQTGWVDGRPDFIDARDRFPYEEVVADLASRPERFFRSFLCSGVTAILDVGGYPWTWRLRESAERDSLAPRLAAAGPLLSTIDFWLNLPDERQFVFMAEADTVRRAVRAHAARRADAVKVWFIVSGDRDFEEMAALVRVAGETAAELGLPLIVHATGVREARVAVEAGAKLLVHSVNDAALPPELLEEMAGRGVFYAPTLTVVDGYRRLAEAAAEGRVPSVDDPNGCVSEHVRSLLRQTPSLRPPGDEARRDARRRAVTAMRRVAEENLLQVARAGVPVVLGTDAGNPLTLHGPAIHAELEAMQAAGMAAGEVLIAATRNGAAALGRPDLGVIERGRRADLLVLAADPTIDIAALRELRAVMRGGELRSVEELAALARQPDAAAGR